MKMIQNIELDVRSREELLPEFDVSFPYIANCVDLEHKREPEVPWHWHRAVELFYVKSGMVEYTTSSGVVQFPAGTGGFLNSNVLHATHLGCSGGNTVQWLHLFDPVLLAGEPGSRIDERYILPMTSARSRDLISLDPSVPEQALILEEIRSAFEWNPDEWGYELMIREALSRIWMKLLVLVKDQNIPERIKQADNKIKELMVFIHEHYQEAVSVAELAEAVHISKRACFRLFRENLRTTPGEYIRSYRLRQAKWMLVQTGESITSIGYACGLGSGSYFGKLFREAFGCTPAQYRKLWHDCDSIQQ